MSLMRLLSTIATLYMPLCACAIPSANSATFSRSDLASDFNTSLHVDLGYTVYKGVANSSTGLNTFKGVRFAAPPTGPLRWQPPRKPVLNRTSVQSAASYSPICPQSFNAVPGNDFVLGDEDCLFLNIYAPPDAADLPVLVWIHGGGYGFFNGQQDMSSIINTNNNSFIGVGIQYRLGAFGFLSSDEVSRNGVVNAGLLDQKFALEWIQEHIYKFGGDASKVTIAGLSAGAGSVMLHNIAYGGSLGTSLFTNSITASPYLPTQYNYNDFLPTQAYYAFAAAAGCPRNSLTKASHDISTSGTFGSWAFLPVTDGEFIRETPSQALLKRKINGLRHLTSNTAEEGPAYTPQTITTEYELIAWLLHTFPLLTNEDVQNILYYYPFNPSIDGNAPPEYPTAGDSGATAVTTSQISSGHQQRANAILGETTFMCPSYWLTAAFSSSQTRHHSYKYQYSVPTAFHGYDLESYFGPARRNQGPDLLRALQTSWGNFVRFGDPSIPSSIADGANDTRSEPHPLEHWPEWSSINPQMAVFNQTGGTPYEFIAVQVKNDGPLTVVANRDKNVTLHTEPGLRNDFRVVDAYAWEGRRGARCDFWRSIGAIVPE
ncbi:uncharacterized protein JN550_007676 [Neoarthrinium moseri]|uniref:uncharacterized protein n=1 Tax=Neoarthrinium moseri TaxID=1658444 RepID=UPI001FDE3979|nr:uncharacterized protein JN550_007676 [Neoarthrinium moseri]KAI1866288.1 hypothetical protein JN550_007676 [Neoarthrinium moseri]